MTLLLRYILWPVFIFQSLENSCLAVSKTRIDSLKAAQATPANDSEKVVILNAKAHKFLLESHFENALATAHKAYSLSRKINYLPGQSRGLLNMGNYYLVRNNLKKAKLYYAKGLTIARQINDDVLIADCANSMGEAHRIEGNNDLALARYLEATRIDERTNNQKCLAEDYHNIGIMYKYLGNSTKAYAFFKRSITLSLKVKNEYNYAEDLLLIGDIKLEDGNVDSALYYFNKVLDIRTRTGYKPGICVSYMRLAMVANKKGDYATGIKNYQVALDNAIACDEQYMAAACLGSLGETYFFKKDYKNALQYAQQSLSRTLKLGMQQETRDMYLLLSKIYPQTSESKKGLEYLNLYVALNDSLNKSERKLRVAEMQTKYETEKKEQENKTLSQVNKMQTARINQSRYLIIALCTLALLIAGIAFLLVRQSRLNIIHAKKEMEQKLLRSQMNPHFIFNAMVGIQNYIYKEEPEVAANYLSSVVQLMRLIIDNSKMEYVPLEKEISTLHHYLTLQQVRFAGKFNFAITTDPAIDIELLQIPPMMAQPVIENAIVHGIMHKKNNDGLITVNFRLENEMLLLEVVDNGIGRQKAHDLEKKEASHLSISTDITTERLKLLNRRAKRKNSVNITDIIDEQNQPLGTKVTFLFSIT
jgi:tetratricopeptide (TPR) repeat protein